MKKLALLGILALIGCQTSPAVADTVTIWNMSNGGTITTTDRIPISRCGTAGCSYYATVGSMAPLSLPAAGLLASTGTDITSVADGTINWNAAYSWGNHATAGYLTAVTATGTNPLTLTATGGAISGSILQATATQGGYVTSTDWGHFNTAYGWGNHASAGYLTGNQTITLSGDATGSGATSLAVTFANSATARSNLGLGTIATQAASNVAITGGTLTGVTVTGTLHGNADTATTATSISAGALDTLTSASGTSQGILGRIKTGAYALITGSPIKAELYGLTGTNASTNLQAAVDDSILLGLTLEMPAGTVNGCATYTTGFKIRGQGSYLSKIKTPDGLNCDPLSTEDAASLWGTDSVGGSGDVEISDITLDGNRANNTANNCLSFYGWHPVFNHVQLQNCPVYGFRSEWPWGGEPVGGMEGDINGLVIDTTGQHGWRFNGPHDTHFDGIIVMDASQSTAKTYAGIYLEGKNMFGSRIHTWTRSGSYGTLWGLQEVAGNIHLEGGMFEEPVLLNSHGNMLSKVDISVYNSGATNSVYPLVLLDTAGSSIDVSINCSGTNPIYGIQMGQSGHLTGQNNIQAMLSGCSSGALDMTYSNGANNISVVGWDIGDSPSMTGTPSDSDNITITSSDWSNSYHWDGYNRGNRLIVGTATNENVIVGARGDNITTGSYNTVFGYLAGDAMTSTSNSTFIGFQAGENQQATDASTAVGLNALRGVSSTPGTGYYHTAVGVAALEKVQGETAGNTAVGYLAGNTITTGSSNTVIGYNVATTTLTTGSDNILIGTSSSTDTTAAGSSNQISIGNTILANSTGGVDLELKGSAPTVASGSSDCGTSPSIAGNNNVMRITVGSSTNGAKCTVTFNNTVAWTNIPACVCNNNTSAARPVSAVISSTATFAATASGTLTAGDKISCHCIGYRQGGDNKRYADQNKLLILKQRSFIIKL